MGQDPYHRPKQAHGLSFSVQDGVRIPPSLKNIFVEVRECTYPNFEPESGNLTKWAEQGVLLLNSFLTVRKGKPLSHSKIGWGKFTDEVVRLIDEQIGEECVFLLWGKHARSKKSLIQHAKCFTCSHPSPYSVGGFSGCRHFLKANEWLVRKGREGIEWSAVDCDF